jgi:hypothetical protein
MTSGNRARRPPHAGMELANATSGRRCYLIDRRLQAEVTPRRSPSPHRHGPQGSLGVCSSAAAVGLRDQTLYPGKLSGSWVTLAEDDPEYKRTRDACLWHYHIGLPYYTQSYAGYKTSEWLLHFQWPNWATGGTHIEIVDLYTHYKSDGQFYLPSDYRLSIYAPPPIPAAPPAQDPLPAKDRKAET